MKRNIRKNLKKSKGITLVALVITIIVLLILAGVSISAVFSQQGIFNRAENAVDKHSQSKARETLDLVFSEAQMKKYDEGLSDVELDKMIEGVGQLLPKDDPESKYQLVIVDGYIFEIDRSVPKVVEYKGPADGIIITATISGNNGWVKPGESVTVKGSIKIYGEGSIANSSATSSNSSVSLTGFPTKGGDFTINNITEDTDIKITATDSTGKSYEKTIQVVIKRDTTPPKISKYNVTSVGLKIIIEGKAEDDESGLAEFTYSITPTTVLKQTGSLMSGRVEIEATAEGTYAVTLKAKDNVNNETISEVISLQIVDGLTIEQAKTAVGRDGLKEHIGTKVIDYTAGGGTWRIFYYGNEFNDVGDITPRLYLKRDYDERMALRNYISWEETTTNAMMIRRLNPLWSTGIGGSSINLMNEHCALYFCDPTQWTTYYDSKVAEYAIGAPSIEMWTKAYNAYIEKYEPNDNKVNYKIKNENGYIWGLDNGNLSESLKISIDQSKLQSKVIATNSYQWLASPSSYSIDRICYVCSEYVDQTNYDNKNGYCPVVSLKP